MAMTASGFHAETEAPFPAMASLAILTAVTVELVRSTGPLLELAFDVSVIAAAATAICVYAGAAILGLGLVWAARRSSGPAALGLGVVVLAVARLVLQALSATPRVVVGFATISLSVAVLTIAFGMIAGRQGGGRSAAVSMAAGAALSMGLQLGLGTWDAYWRDDWRGWGVTLALLASLGGATELARRQPRTAANRDVNRLWAVGPALGLLVMVMANAGFAASQSDVRLAIAGPVASLGLILAGAGLSLHDPARQLTRATPAATGRLVSLAPAAAIAGIFWSDGPIVLVLLVIAQFSAFLVLAGALDRTRLETASRTGSIRHAESAALVGVGTIVPLLVFQLDYDIPLGFPNELVIVATAAVLGAAVIDGRQVVEDHPARPAGHPSFGRRPDRSSLALVTATGLIAFLGSAIAIGHDLAHDPRAPAGNDTITLVSWNLHYGVDPDAGVDLEEIARRIEQQNPSIVALQEVSRGWVLGGGTDMATWLSQRLDMELSYAPAADRQFGNALLTNLPTKNVTVIDLPYGNGPQERSAISADIDLPSGALRVSSVHLQNKAHIPTRLDQIDTLLAAQADAQALIIAGDFNAQPGSPEIETMIDTGLLVSAQDVSGDPSALTDPSINPDKRIDWVFGRGVSFIETEVLAGVLSSDHLPLVVRFRPS